MGRRGLSWSHAGVLRGFGAFARRPTDRETPVASARPRCGGKLADLEVAVRRDSNYLKPNCSVARGFDLAASLLQERAEGAG